MIPDWKQLYALQDEALQILEPLDHEFYLTGGTALSRGFYEHRYSEDLGFFVNDRKEFELWRDRCLHALDVAAKAHGWRLDIILRESRFGRAVLNGPVPLKLEFVNDVPFRIGEPSVHPALGRLDTRENILANKVSALVDRSSPKDVADIYWLCCRDGLDLVRAIENSSGKAAGIFPPLVAKALNAALQHGLPDVAWINKPEESEFKAGLQKLVQRLME